MSAPAFDSAVGITVPPLAAKVFVYGAKLATPRNTKRCAAKIADAPTDNCLSIDACAIERLMNACIRSTPAVPVPEGLLAPARVDRGAEAVLRIEPPVLRDVGHRKQLVAAVDVVRPDRECAAVAVREARRRGIAAVRAEQAEPRLDALI